MKLEKRFSNAEFKKVIDTLEKNKIGYYVFGGYFIDAMLKEETEHRDLDIIVNQDDKRNLISSLDQIGYSSKEVGRMLGFERKTKNNIYQIGAILFRKLKDCHKIRGNLSEELVSNEAFNQDNYLSLNGTKFKVMPYEWFSLYRKIDHMNPNKRKRHQRAMDAVTPFCKKLKILRHTPINRIKSDPNMKKSK